jgi:hypothetical protein
MTNYKMTFMKKIIMLVTIAALFYNCNKFEDTNVSPALLTEPSTKALLTNSQQSISELVFGNVASSRLASMYVQHLSEGPYPGPSLYNDRNLSFSTWYTGPLFNLENIIKYNNEGANEANPSRNGSKNNQIAVARILKAYFYLLMTDKWGDIPYSQALKGNEQYAPAYDKQQDIYTNLFKELTEAAAQINEAEAKVVGDVIFNGNMATWKRFANTIRLVMGLRLSAKDPTKGKAEYASALAAGVITSNAQNMSYTFITGDPNNSNPWYNNYTASNRNDYAISKTLTDYMGPKNDPRLPVYGEVLSGGVVGLTYGRNVAVNIPAAYSRIGNYFRDQGASMPLFNYAQVLFMRAEAAKLGYETGGDAAAEQFYKDAIKASWQQYGVFNQAAYDAYLLLPGVAYVAATGHKQIMTEKWVHMYLNSWESWNDWRRTGFPTLTPAVDAVDSRGIPLRLGYPTNEVALNNANYLAAVAGLGGPDDNYGKMWWRP